MSRKPVTFPLPFVRKPARPRTLYECGICENLHPWAFDGDCRDNTNRIEEARPNDTVLSWADRCAEDAKERAKAAKPARVAKPAPCRPADTDPILMVVGTRTLLELLRYRIRNLDRPLGSVPEGHELN